MPRNNVTSGVRIISNTIPARLRALQVGMDHAIGAVMQYEANEGQNYMRANAPWTDRTGAARQGLFVRYFRGGKTHTIVLWHSVPYGIWLELAHGRKYKIVEPAWRKTSAEVMTSLRRVMGSVR